jgi:hypothetical protein
LNRKRIINLAVVIFLVFFISQMPARLVLFFIPSNVQLAQIEGTLWSGHAGKVTINKKVIENVDWSFAWWSLFSSCIGMNIEQQNKTNHIDARVGVSWSGKSCISSIDGQYQAKLIGPWLNPSLPQLGGRFEFNDVGVWFSNGMPVAAEGEIIWRKAGINTGSSLALGEYLFVLDEAEEEEGITIAVKENKQRFDGNLLLTITPDRRLKASGKIRPRNANDPLKPFMGFLGSEDGEGYYVVKRELVLPR